MRLTTRIKETGAPFARSWWPIAIIAALTGFLVYQQWRYMHPRSPVAVHVGDRLNAILLETLEGQPVEINWRQGERPTVLYVFRKDCVWCIRNSEAARALAEQVSAKGYRFVAVSLGKTGLSEYLAANHFSFPVYVAETANSLKKQLKSLITPETIVVAPGGAVTHVWLGAYSGGKHGDLEGVFGVKLPLIPDS